MITPVNVDTLEHLLKQTRYCEKESKFLIQGFHHGFDIGFRGNTKVCRKAPNLKFTIGNERILWEKVMKEVKLKRFAEPFDEPPFQHFIQSPIGLVAKDGGKDTRLIFHLSFPRGGESINSGTPVELTKVKYPDFSEAVKRCLEELRLSESNICYVAKLDMKSAFRNLGISPHQFFLLVMKARSPLTARFQYFVDRALPFGASISCSHFQRFSNCVAYIIAVKTRKSPVKYLDNYLFISYLRSHCQQQVRIFLSVCEQIQFPVSMEKTYWSTTLLTFLGLIQEILTRCKVTVKQLQRLSGFLNFLCRAIVPGRTFMRRLYNSFSPLMKPHYHVNISAEIKEDLRIWLSFLEQPTVYSRPFIDFTEILTAEDLDLFTDASGKGGCGAIFGSHWFKFMWPKPFLDKCKPSIEYQELFAVAIAIDLWIPTLQNRRICLFCDNKSVQDMINQSSFNYKNLYDSD